MSRRFVLHNLAQDVAEVAVASAEVWLKVDSIVAKEARLGPSGSGDPETIAGPAEVV